MDFVDPKTFQKNAKTILKSENLLKKVSGSRSGFLVRGGKSANVKVLVGNRKEEQSRTQFFRSQSQLATDTGSITSETNTSVTNSISRPTTSEEPLPYHTSQSIHRHQAHALEFRDFIVPQQGSASDASFSNIQSSKPYKLSSESNENSSMGRKSPNLTTNSIKSRIPMSPEFSAAHNLTDLKGNFVPTNSIKEAMLSTVRRHTDHLNREVLYSSNNSVALSSVESSREKQKQTSSNKNNLDAQLSLITTDSDDFRHLHMGNSIDEETKEQSNLNSSKIVPLGSIAKGELGFNDSLRTLPIGDFVDVNHPGQEAMTQLQQTSSSLVTGNKENLPHRAISTKDIDESPAWKSLLSFTSRAKLASIVRVEDDYSMKWMKMKNRRDLQRQKEEIRQQNLALQHFFRRVQINSEQNELHKVKVEKQHEEEEEKRHRQQKIMQLREVHETFYHQRKKDREHEKQIETKQLKQTIAQSVAQARQVVENEIAEQRALVLETRNRQKEAKWQEFTNFSQDSGWVHPGSRYIGHDKDHGESSNMDAAWGCNLEELSSFTGHSDNLDEENEEKLMNSMKMPAIAEKTGQKLEEEPSMETALFDDTVSSVVEIPSPLQKKLKEATSLRVFQEAKKEIKDYYDSMMSMRIHRFVHSKEIARRHVQDRETSKVSRPPFHAGMFFSDSITLNSAVDDSRSDIGDTSPPRQTRSRSPILSPAATASRSYTQHKREESAALRAVAAALTDPAATPMPPYHLDPLVVADSYGLSLSTHQPAPMSSVHTTSNNKSSSKAFHRKLSSKSPPRQRIASQLHPSDSAHLMMRHTPLTPLVPFGLTHEVAPTQLPPTNLRQLQEFMARDSHKPLTGEQYAALISAAAAAVTGGTETNQYNTDLNHQDSRTSRSKSIYDGKSADDDDDDIALPPTSLGAKKKSLIMRSFSNENSSGEKTSFSSVDLATFTGDTDGSYVSNSDLFQLPGSKRDSINPATHCASYASLLRNQSIRKSLSGFLPINATNFDAQTEQHAAIFGNFQNKITSQNQSSNATANDVRTDTTTAPQFPGNLATNSTDQTADTLQQPIPQRNSMTITTADPSIDMMRRTTQIAENAVDDGNALSPHSQLSNSSHAGASVTSQTSSRSQQVRLVLPPLGIGRTNSTESSVSLNRGMSRPVLMDFALDD